jgi:hypothetical protein
MLRQVKVRLVMLLAGACLAGCMTTQTSFTPVVKGVAAKPKDYPIEIFMGDDKPSRPFEEVATLDVHLEATHFIQRGFKDAEPGLKQQARAAGADAIIAVKEIHSRYLETSIYHVTAKAIRYMN